MYIYRYTIVFAQTNMQLTFHEMNVDLPWQFRRGFLMVSSGLTPAGLFSVHQARYSRSKLLWVASA